jgi:hypothetical protein
VRRFLAERTELVWLRTRCGSSTRRFERVVMDVLGHSQFSITLDLYSHVMPNALGDAADAIDRALNGGRRLSTVGVKADLTVTVGGDNCP